MFLTVQEWLSPSLISVANGQTERDTTIVLCLIPARFLTSPPIPLQGFTGCLPRDDTLVR
jgi:hypothetical protein